MVEELRPRQSIGNGITPVILNTLLDKIGIGLAKEALLSRLIGEVDDDEPRQDSDDLSQNTLDDLYRVRTRETVEWRGSECTKIHCHPLIPLNPSICIRPYAKIAENPPTSAEIK